VGDRQLSITHSTFEGTRATTTTGGDSSIFGSVLAIVVAQLFQVMSVVTIIRDCAWHDILYSSFGSGGMSSLHL
jgi:hypothetical protein